MADETKSTKETEDTGRDFKKTIIKEKEKWLKILGAKRNSAVDPDITNKSSDDTGEVNLADNPRLGKLAQKFQKEKQVWTQIVATKEEETAALKRELAQKNDQLHTTQLALEEKSREMEEALKKKDEESTELKRKSTQDLRDRETAYLREMESWIDELISARRAS